jgi:hypothetical protein
MGCNTPANYVDLLRRPESHAAHVDLMHRSIFASLIAVLDVAHLRRAIHSALTSAGSCPQQPHVHLLASRDLLFEHPDRQIAKRPPSGGWTVSVPSYSSRSAESIPMELHYK